jgi:hypothetical protein
LETLVKRKLVQKGDNTCERIRARKAKKAAALIAAMAVVLLVVSGGLAWTTHSDQQAALRLKEQGVPGEGEILRRYLAPNGVTPRLEYRVTAPDGRTGTRDAELDRRFWNSLEGKTQVEVVYVPDNPENSLVVGESGKDDLTENPKFVYVLCAVLGVFSLALWPVAVLYWKGWSLDLDSKTRKFSIKAYGTGR